jgi:hypothetical protein
MKDILEWQLLVLTLPSNNATARTRIWRALKGLGCAPLRDGAYLLPYTVHLEQQLSELAGVCLRESGSAWLLAVAPRSEVESSAYRALFDRSAEYAHFLNAIADANVALSAADLQSITRARRKLQREYEALRATDYFPGDASSQAETAWAEFVSLSERRLSPGEPLRIEALIPRRDITAYRGRVWATRRGLWVDRVACAWLIRRFIDRKASFLWLASPQDCPAKALGFDYDGAEFTHIGKRVTFEVLLASFGLDADAGLSRLGAMVRFLDVGDGFVAEASGFEAILDGARQRTADDDSLLSEVSGVLDSLYAYFSKDDGVHA